MKNSPSTNQRISVDKYYELWLLLIQARDTIRKVRDSELKNCSLPSRQSAVLWAIQMIGPKATPAEISRWLFRERNSISELISRMEKDGLVKKVKDLDRRDLVRVVMTEKGYNAYSKGAKRESIRKIMSTLTDKEHQQLRLCLQKLRKVALKEISPTVKIPFPPLE